VRQIIAVAAALLPVVWSCQPAHRPQPMPPRTAVAVNASFNRTWQAALDAFKDQNVEALTDRYSGTIRGTVEVMSGDQGGQDCGVSNDGKAIRPQLAGYRITIKGDSTTSTVIAAATYLSAPGLAVQECGSRGTWESQVEMDVKRRAESR